jgi:hypothetical protein
LIMIKITIRITSNMSKITSSTRQEGDSEIDTPDPDFLSHS